MLYLFKIYFKKKSKNKIAYENIKILKILKNH